MSERYKVLDNSAPNFITLTIIDWVDLFIRPVYFKILDNALNYCIENKGLEINAYVYMSSHIHLMVSSNKDPIPNIIKSFKIYTTKEFLKAINESPESRREWLLNKFSYAADRIKRGKNYKIWKDGFHPIILDNPLKVEQRINYIHNNPYQSQLIREPRDWKNSSCLQYENEKCKSNVWVVRLY